MEISQRKKQGQQNNDGKKITLIVQAEASGEGRAIGKTVYRRSQAGRYRFHPVTSYTQAIHTLDGNSLVKRVVFQVEAGEIAQRLQLVDHLERRDEVTAHLPENEHTTKITMRK